MANKNSRVGFFARVLILPGLAYFIALLVSNIIYCAIFENRCYIKKNLSLAEVIGPFAFVAVLIAVVGLAHAGFLLVLSHFIKKRRLLYFFFPLLSGLLVEAPLFLFRVVSTGTIAYDNTDVILITSGVVCGFVFWRILSKMQC
ncbi:hypothetical protein [Chitinimonas sp.]|uniref:hypothetical protein n=1 Tax=Chitinimonas sp. TaxID=1934313 RepID=UPI0035B09D91